MCKGETVSKRKSRKKSNGKSMEIRIVIGIPLERTIHQLAFMSFLAIAQQGFPFIKMYYGRTDLVRNKMAEQVLKAGNYTHLLMLDADHIHPPHIVARLAGWVIKYPEVKVVGGLNFRRGEPYDPCAFILGEDGQYYPPVSWEQGLVKVDALGTGSILIAKEVFEAGPPPWFYNDYSKCSQDVWPGEDMGFADYCRQHGFDQWVDTTLNSPHIIDALVDESSFRLYLEDHPHQVAPIAPDRSGSGDPKPEQQRSGEVFVPDMTMRIEA